MNILEAFENALPEIPAKSGRERNPKLDSNVIFKEHMEHGVPTILAKVPGGDNYARFTRSDWALIQLFDGERSFEEVTELLPERAGVAYSVEAIKEFVSVLQDKTEIFYRTP